MEYEKAPLSKVEVVIPKLARIHCRECGYVEWVDSLPCSFPVHCPECGGGVCSGHPPFNAIVTSCDNSPHEYNLMGKEREYQIYFHGLPEGLMSSRCFGVTCGEDDPRDEIDINDPFEVIEYVVERLEKYIYASTLESVKKIQSYMTENEKEVRLAIERRKLYKNAERIHSAIKDYRESVYEIEELEGK